MKNNALMILYQTVEDRDNPEHIELNAPFICDRTDAWLGEGYYFWDTLIDNAHWWGKTVYKQKGHVVLKFLCDSINERCFDLHGNLEHLKYFNEIADFFKNEEVVDNSTTVSMIIEFLKENASLDDKYDGIRVYGHNSKSRHKTIKMLFRQGRNSNQYIELAPPVQLCLFRKNSFNLQPGVIVYPSHYVSGTVV